MYSFKLSVDNAIMASDVLAKMDAGQSAGFVVTDLKGTRLAVCHSDIHGDVSAPQRVLDAVDLIVCCHPGVAQMVTGRLTVGDWYSQTWTRVQGKSLQIMEEPR